MLIWIFGDVEHSSVATLDDDYASGKLMLQNAEVDWVLSVDYNKIPEDIRTTGARTYRSLKIDEEEFEFSGGFTELHNISYEKVLNGQGFGIKEAKKSISLVHKVRNT
jgi:UDP-N-acetyl-2-amino-2-deoxyglucuronate dehydrogenase